jgi:K+-transporting ATPase ATPase A chain
MSAALAAGLQIFLVIAALALVHVPLGDYMARVFTPAKHNRAERGLYRTLRINPSADQRWTTYLVSVLAFSAVSIGLLWVLLSIQSWLPFANDTPNMPAAQGFNTAVSFVTNTNWQSYSGETALGYTIQAIGLTVPRSILVRADEVIE